MHDYKHFQQQQKKNVVPAAINTFFDLSNIFPHFSSINQIYDSFF